MAMLCWLSFCASELSQFQGWVPTRGDPHGGQPCRQEAAHNRLHTVRVSHWLGSDVDSGEGKWLTPQGT